MPKRPEWNYKMDKRQVEMNEEQMFQRYIKDIRGEHEMSELSYFEMNLEVRVQTISSQITAFLIGTASV